MKTAPKCSKKTCNEPCEYYGPIGGYSVQCAAHNQLRAAGQRANRAKLKAQRGYTQPRYKTP